MRITLVTRIFSPEPSAASQRLESLADALVERGDELTVVTAALPRRSSLPARAFRYRVSRWPVLRDRAGYVRGYLPYLTFDVPAIFRVLFSRRADVVVVEPPPTTGAAMRLACSIRRIPYVYYAADIWSLAARSTGAPKVVLRVVRALEAFALRGAARVLAVTAAVADQVRVLAPHARTTVVGHGVDERIFHADVTSAEPPLDAVYMGTASEWHGAMVFIEALRILNETGVRPRVAFVGQGSEWESLQQAVRQAGLETHVTFSGPVAPERAAARLRGARVALASLRPQIGYDFAVPTKMYSSVAVGTPVLLSAPEPLRSLVSDAGIGWGCSDSPDDVARALAEAVAEDPTPARRASIGRWAEENIAAVAVARRAADAIALARRGAPGDARP
jgi:glycosyltransferase involved in cell wall biosynthesis